jgi:hypothetical protein
VGRKKAVDGDDEDTPPAGYVAPPPAWESRAVSKNVQTILDSLEIPKIDPEARSTLQRWVHRADRLFAGDRGDILLTLRAIAESEGNGPGAIMDPILCAVHSARRPEWQKLGLSFIEAFDSIDLRSLLRQMRDLKCFSKSELSTYLATAIRSRLWEIFGPDVVPVAPKAKPLPKPPLKVTRIPVIEKRIAIGVDLMKLRAQCRRNNDFSALRRKRFPDLDPRLAMEAKSVAVRYSARPEIYRHASWHALLELSAPSLPSKARMRFEARIVAGEEVTGKEIEKARGPNRSAVQPEQRAA